MERWTWVAVLLVLAGILRAEGPAPDQDDAALHAVHVSGQHGWAVGDRGTIWKTEDGGESWRFVPSGVLCPLRSVFFLNGKIGWVAGGEIGPYALRASGTLLGTTDGGESWQRVGLVEHVPAHDQKGAARRKTSPSLPRLHHVRFFSREHGIVLGDPDDEHVTGALVTVDGGATWTDIPGTVQGNWRSADILSPVQGVVVGMRGAVGLFTEGQLVPARNAVVGLPAVCDVALSAKGVSWLVGEGGTILQSDNAGTSWRDPPRPLPQAVRRLFDFRTVFVRGSRVWLAGNPGSVIWHSPDDGQSWFKQRTGQTLPISDVQMATDTEGCAVGELGTILRTTNGGRSWEIARGEGRRLAILAVHGRRERICWEALTACAGEDGYRTRVQVLSRSDVGADGTPMADDDARLREAATAVGGSGVAVDWQFSQTTPGLDVDFDKLVDDWNQRTEGRLKELLVAQFARDLRVWRPTVVVLDRPSGRDGIARLIHEVLPAAIEQASDPTRFVDQTQYGALEPWTVDRVCERLPAAEIGPIGLDPWRYLPRLGRSLSMASEPARSRLTRPTTGDVFAEPTTSLTRESFQALDNLPAQDLFAGIVLMPGGEARRELRVLDDRDLTAGHKRAERQRNFASYLRKYLPDPRHAGQLLAQLDDITKDMSPAEAARQMATLAESHLAQGQWELAELQLIQLIERYPDEPIAHRASLRLIQFWTGAETTWRRLRRSEIDHRQQRFQGDSASTAIEQALARLDSKALDAGRQGYPFGLEESVPEKVDPASVETPGATERIFVRAKRRYWLNHATRLAGILQQDNPSLYGTASAQFSLAALHRGRGNSGKSADIYRRFFQDPAHPWFAAAAGEVWAMQRQTVLDRTNGLCRFTPERPTLDGVLSETCWQDAAELPLTAIPGEPPAADHSFAMLAHDSQWLYLAARVVRAPGGRNDPPKKDGRKRDDDLSDFDRLTLLLDVDRDYSTHFRLTVDQRGCTAEDCWSDRSWNPRWHVAADGDETHWRIEAAILLDELTPDAPSEGELWNVNIVRTIPQVGTEAWSHPATREPRLENSGLVKFEK